MVAPAALIALPAGVVDIDIGDIDSPEYAVEYVHEIYAYMREQEVRKQCSAKTNRKKAKKQHENRTNRMISRERENHK